MHRVGIESDQLVYDYLSRVGDLAQQQQLSSGARMRLVSTLRSEIDRQRATGGADSPAAVRRIIGGLGTPDELVGAAAESGDGTVPLPPARSGPAPRTSDQRRPLPRPRNGLLRKSPKAPEEPEQPRKPGRSDSGPASGSAPKTRSWRGASRPAEPAAGRPRTELGKTTRPDDTPVPNWPHPSAPHVLGPDQQSTGDGEWWRLEPGPFDAGTAIPGFFGGIEAPELLGRRPRPEVPEADEEAEDAEEGDESGTEEGGDTEEAPRRRALRIPRPRRRKPVVVAEPVVAAAPAPRGGFAHPLLLLAALLLLAGAVTGSWIPLAGGWLIAYGSRTLSRTEAKWAALGLPGVVVAAALVWVWGRMDGRWGEPIAQGALRDVLAGAWPVVVRVAAVASALYLVWRARRRTG
ncbi:MULTISPECIES: hypothetical protein [Streptomyces]|uniref:Integral membrane protein n=1 Tax=Streptomyces microflavus TaxID=1919 RepID=A0ABV1PW58_STRMI|nr:MULTISPECIES: hypothetical protein [Streptomyces]QTA33767.1 hypothetical protein JHY03_39570 [Streptomyces sp. CA-256286]WSR93015.1 hypothetical protein OG728_22650 [Streptomyces microflavus]